MSAVSGFKLGDAQSYDDVAEAFDALSERYNAPFAARLLELAEISPSDQIVDVGAGTGLLTLAAARAVAGRGRVLGVDLSEGMLHVARERAVREGLAADFRPMDAERLELEDATCDVVLSLFALLHFPDPGRALREMKRVLKPGGRLALAVGSPPPLLSRFAVRRAGERLLALFRSAPELRAPDTLDAIVDRLVPARGREEMGLARSGAARPARVDRLVRDAGLAIRTTDWMSLETEIQDVGEFWTLQRTFSSRARKRLSAATPAEVEAVRMAFLDRARAVRARGGRLVYGRAAFFIAGCRPAAER